MSVRLSYADCDGNGTINPATEILEENNYYPFGLQHQGYNDIANSCRNEEAEAYKFLNKEYEDSFALNVTETDFRHYDSALGRFNVLDPMAELAYDFTPYRYGFNNPVFWQDATGLFESYDAAEEYRKSNRLFGASIDFDSDANVWKILDGERTITQIGNIINTMYMMEGEMYLEQTNAGGGSGGNFGSQLSADVTNAYSSSGLRHAVNWWNRNVDFGIYDFLYNNSAVTGYGSGEYGPWIPDAFGVSLSAGAWGSSIGFSMVLDNSDNFDWFISYSGGAGYTGAGFSVGGTFDLYNNSDPTKTALNGIPGPTYDFSAGYGLMGGYSTPFDPVTRKMTDYGVQKYSFGLGSGVRAGEGRTYSSGDIYKSITNYFNSFNR